MEIIKLDDFPIDAEQDQVFEIYPDKTKVVASTNRLFNKYPTRYISAVPRFAINKYSSYEETILDPFCGSGTTAIEAMLLDRNAVSIDIDPFARLLIKVKTTKYTPKDILIIERLVEKLKNTSIFSNYELCIPEIPNIEKWFCHNSIKGLASIKKFVDDETQCCEHIRDYFYVVIAGIIRKCSNADEVSPKPYISTRYPKTPEEPFTIFFKFEEMYRKAIIEFFEATKKFNNYSSILGSNDARKIETESVVDLAVTSPPYINAYDYVRSLRFEDMWLGLADDSELRENKKFYVGTESSSSFYDNYEYITHSGTLKPIIKKIEEVDRKRAAIVSTYFEDMAINMEAVRKVLKKNGRYVIVVGDSNIRNQHIPTATILKEIATDFGYDFDLSFKYVIRDRYMHLPRAGRGGIINYDELLILSKK